MTEPSPQQSQESHSAQALDTFTDVLRALVGKVVTVANVESYEDAPVGHRLGAGFYKAKVVDVKRDFLVLATNFQHASGNLEAEAVRQYLPFSQVKRISVMKSEKILHL